MADINQTITLGIGTPGGIPEFLTFGLQIGPSAAAWTPINEGQTASWSEISEAQSSSWVEIVET
jgi:hypothetical protein